MKLHARVTRSLVELVKRFEGLRRQAGRLPDGGWTVGYGHVVSAREGAVVTAQDAEALLYYDLSLVAERVEAWTFAPLNQNQFEALTAFAFNIGLENFRQSAVLKRVNEGQTLLAASALELWRKAELGGEALVVDALVRRRAAEKAHFLTPPEGFKPSPTPVLRPRLDETGGEVFLVSPFTASPIPEAQGGQPGGLQAMLQDDSAPPFHDPAQTELPFNTAPAPRATENAWTDAPFSAPFPEALAVPDVEGSPSLAEDAPFGALRGEGATAKRIPDPAPQQHPVPDDTLPPPPVEARALSTQQPYCAPVSDPQSRAPQTGVSTSQTPYRGGLSKGGRTLLFALTGVLGLILTISALVSVLGSKASPLNLVFGLIGIIFLTYAGGFFALRSLNTKDGLLTR